MFKSSGPGESGPVRHEGSKQKAQTDSEWINLDQESL